MKRISRLQGLAWCLALVPAVLVLIFYAQLPEQIPMEWDFGDVVRYGPKEQILILAGIPLIFAVLFPLLPKIDPHKHNYEKFGTAYLWFQVLMMLFFVGMIGLVLVESFYPHTIAVGSVVSGAVGILFLVLGNMMPKFRQNYFCGCKTPWTLADKTVWTRTHRLAGRLFFAAGLIQLISSFFTKGVLLFTIFMVATMVAALIPAVMSYVWYRQLHPND